MATEANSSQNFTQKSHREHIIRVIIKDIYDGRYDNALSYCADLRDDELNGFDVPTGNGVTIAWSIFRQFSCINERKYDKSAGDVLKYLMKRGIKLDYIGFISYSTNKREINIEGFICNFYDEDPSDQYIENLNNIIEDLELQHNPGVIRSLIISAEANGKKDVLIKIAQKTNKYHIWDEFLFQNKGALLEESERKLVSLRAEADHHQRALDKIHKRIGEESTKMKQIEETIAEISERINQKKRPSPAPAGQIFNMNITTPESKLEITKERLEELFKEFLREKFSK